MSACGSNKSSSLTPDASLISGVSGTWIAAVAPSEGNVLERSLTIRDDGVTMTTVCRASGGSVTVRATSPAVVTGTQIRVLRTDVQSRAARGETCQAQIDQGSFEFEVRGDELLLKRPGQQQFVFGRRDRTQKGDVDPTSEGQSKLMEFLNQGAAAVGES